MSTLPFNSIFCNDGGWHRPPRWRNYTFVFKIPRACINRKWTDCPPPRDEHLQTLIATECVIDPLTLIHALKYWSHHILFECDVIISYHIILIECSHLYSNYRTSLMPTVWVLQNKNVVIDSVDGNDSKILRSLVPPQQQPFYKLKGQHRRNASDYELISFV